jgi:membrane protein YqaA with SNARE-associated domain
MKEFISERGRLFFAGFVIGGLGIATPTYFLTNDPQFTIFIEIVGCIVGGITGYLIGRKIDLIG